MKQTDAAITPAIQERDPPSRVMWIALADQALALLNRLLMAGCAMALVAAAVVLTESVVVRYVLRESTDWQDETSVILLVGATFLSAAFVQQRRGHVAIEALQELLSPRAERMRRILADGVSLLFCAFFAWKSWTLTHEAWVDGITTSSTFAPPLWIPYLCMSLGMTLLSLQIAVQIAVAITPDARR